MFTPEQNYELWTLMDMGYDMIEALRTMVNDSICTFAEANSVYQEMLKYDSQF